MVGYGSSLRRARRPGWEDAYLDYDDLRSILEQIKYLYESEIPLPPDNDEEHLKQKFLTRLRKEIEKVSLFTLLKQGEIAEAVGSLRFEDSELQIQPTKTFTDVENASVVSFSSFESNHSHGKEEAALLDSSPSYGGEKAALLDSSPSYGGEEAALLPRGSLVRTLKTPKPLPKAAYSLSRPMFRADQLINKADTMTDSYTALGVELLHLLRFICVNAMGFRKILKKHDKITFPAARHSGGEHDGSQEEHARLVNGPEDNLQHLANSDSIAVIHSSLLAALAELEATQEGSMEVYQGVDEENVRKDFLRDSWRHYPVELIRFKCCVSSIHTLREYAQRVNAPFRDFLSRRAMIMIGQDPGDLERATKQALNILLHFQPDSLLTMDEAALNDWQRRVPSRHNAGFSLFESDSIIDLKDEAHSWGGVNSVSMIINLLSTLLYTVNYYIVAPTANRYAIALGMDGAFGATLVGASSLAAIFAAFLYSFWYTKSSFRSALFFSALCPCLGNLLYALALSCESMQVAFWGRILVGFGSAEVVNRQLISACVSFQSMTAASALFVAAGAIGMSVGPLMAAILDLTAGRNNIVDLKLPWLPAGGIIFNHVTAPGFVMASLWLLELLALVIVFREPERINGSGTQKKRMARFESDVELTGKANDTKYGTGSLPSTPHVHNGQHSAKGVRLWQSIWSQMTMVKKLIFDNMALPVTFLLFGYIELVDEVLISSCAMVCYRYFNWHASRAGLLIASLGALVLPAHYVVERASRRYKERTILKYSVVFICVSLFAILNYEGLIFDIMGVAAEAVDSSLTVNGTDSVDISIGGTSISSFLNKHQEIPYNWGIGTVTYITFLSAVFMGTIILEGVDTSLMAKVTPVALNDTFINCGLLATLVGTLGRVFGDSMITISALVDKNIFTDFVNATFFPMIPLALIGYFLVKQYYNLLL